MNEPRDLALIDKARAALAEASTIEDAKEICDKAAALQHYFAKQKGAEESERYARELAHRAQRRIGEITRAMEKAKAGRKPSREIGSIEEPISKTSALEAAGLTKRDAHVCEAIAAIPEDRFQAEVVKPEATTKRLVRVGREYRPDARAPKRRAEPAKAAARPPVSDRILGQRVQRFRLQVEKLVRRQLARWPSGAPKAVLAKALIEVANTIQEA